MDEFRISDMKRQQKEGPDTPPRKPPRYDEQPDEPLPAHGFTQTSQLSEAVNLRQYWEVILRYRLIVMCITAGIALIAFASSFMKVDMYRARVEILHKEDQKKASYGMEGKFYMPETLAKIAVSRPVMKAAALLLDDALQEFKLGGHEIPESDWEQAREMAETGIAAGLDARIDDEAFDIIYLDAVYPKSRYLVAAIANAVSRSFIERLSDIERREASQKIVILQRLQKTKQDEIHDIEQEILLLKRQQEEQEETFTAIAADETRLLNLVSEYEMMFQENKLKQEELEEQIKAIKRELNVEGIDTEDINWVDMTDVMVRKLQELKLKRAELLTRYTPENSLVIRLDSQIKAMEKSLSMPREAGTAKKNVTVGMLRSKMVTNLIVLESQLQGVHSKLESIGKMRDDLNRKLIELPIKTLKIERLRRQKDVLERLLDDLRHEFQQEKIASTGTISNIQIIESAVPPDYPFSPNRKKMLLSGVVYGLVIAVGVAFLLNHWDNTINTTNEIKARVHVEPLGLIPQWDEEDKFINPAGVDDINAEVYGVLRNNIRYSHAENPEKCLLIASAIQAEGKSLTAANLACSFSFEGNRTLLVSMDLRKKRDYYLFRKEGSVSRKEKGMGDFLAGEADYSNIIYDTKFENLYVVPTGEKRKNPGRLLVPSKLEKFFKDMENNFDVVIIDAPAVLPVVDTTVISPLVRGVLLVIGAGKTPIGACQQAIGRLDHVNSRIIGAVLNKARNIKFDFFYGSAQSYYTGYKDKGKNFYET